jgi:hypothetical protein
MKELKDMSDRDILIWMMGELRHVKKVLTNHLAHHEKQDDRRWKLYVGILLAIITVAGGVAAALLA